MQNHFMKIKSLIVAALFLIACIAANAQDFSLYQKAMMVHGKDTLRYRILMPENFQQGKTYPVIIFLHGSGERGSNNESQLVHGADLFLKPEIRQKFPAIVIFPQCPMNESWNYFEEDTTTNPSQLIFPFQKQPSAPEAMVKQLSDSLIRIGEADKDRIYLGGLSLGGFGTYDLLIRFPKYYAAAFPIAGACNVSLMVQKGGKIPIWIFHGAKDDVVNPKYDRQLYAELKLKNKNVKYSEYPDANHNSWDSAFAEPGLLPWLFSFKR